MQVHTSRRRFIAGIVTLVAMAAFPFKLFARAEQAFEAEDTDVVYRELFGDMPIVDSSDIKLKIPDIAENGAVVPVSISTSIAGVQAIYVIIDENGI